MVSIGSGIVSNSKAEIKALERQTNLGSKRDLLSTLLKPNLSTAIPETQRLNDAEMLGQIPTSFLAGHETKLREEVPSVPSDRPTMDEINSLPYLDSKVWPLSKPYIDKEGKSHDSLPGIPQGQRICVPILAINTDKELSI
ncbi:hypothetical protein B0H14DRAFT_3508041 [Mycena olivaceomarginata]|nr:hypothetical protein B0H14DRAFT_3508041 [Mycena olivaceomarginata]